jgi:quercetin dioxygenase-like cupin family protein
MAVLEPDDAAPKADPGGPAGRVETLGIVLAVIEPGRSIGPHRHDTDEAITVLSGEAEVRIGADAWRIGAGGVAFVPAGAPHETANPGPGRLRIHAVFASTAIVTESVDPDPPSRSRYDLRTDSSEALD